MNDYPLVSIVIASYNGKNFIEQQLISIVNQDYPNFEIVIVDDCSTDGSYEFLLCYDFLNISRTLVRNEVNLGLVKTFERAIILSKGTLIALCDQDDIWYYNKITELVYNINNNDLIHSDARLIDSDGNELCKSFFSSHKHLLHGFPQYLIENNVTGCTSLFRKSLFVALGNKFPNGVTVHDRILAIAASYNNKIKYYNKVLMDYRQHHNNQVGINIDVNTSLSRHLKDIQAIENISMFSSRLSDIKIAKSFFNVLIKKDKITFSLIGWIIRNFGVFYLIKYLSKSVFHVKK